MKQRITAQQLTELSTEALNKWFEWTGKKSYSVKASIGEMIEFIYEAGNNPTWPHLAGFIDGIKLGWPNTLCDDLWNNCKQVLEERV